MKMNKMIFNSNSLTYRSSVGAYAAAAARRLCSSETAPAPAKLAAEAIAGHPTPEKEEPHYYWMRDPKTGNWMPENKISEVEPDPAMLRAKFLPSKK